MHICRLHGKRISNLAEAQQVKVSIAVHDHDKALQQQALQAHDMQPEIILHSCSLSPLLLPQVLYSNFFVTTLAVRALLMQGRGNWEPVTAF